MNPLSRFLAMSAMVWLASWIPIGLWAGDVDFVLTPASRDTAARQLYQILFYSGLLVIFALSWRFLLGHLVERLGWTRGAWLTSFIFALVHLFRPGSLYFKICYGLGLLILGYLLARLAWHYGAVSASAGLHAGIVLFNIAGTLTAFHPNPWAGWNSEPVSGVVSWVFTLGFLGLWHLASTKRS